MGACGESTLARAIARKMGLEFIETDWIRHTPGWQIRPLEDVNRIVLERMEANPRGCLTEHRSRHHRPLILKRAKPVIVLVLPLKTVLWRRFRRFVRRAWTKQVVCGGNRETFWQHFATRESAILEIWQRRKRYSLIGETISAAAPPGLDFYYIQSARQLDEFYEAQGLSKNAIAATGGPEMAHGA